MLWSGLEEGGGLRLPRRGSRVQIPFPAPVSSHHTAKDLKPRPGVPKGVRPLREVTCGKAACAMGRGPLVGVGAGEAGPRTEPATERGLNPVSRSKTLPVNSPHFLSGWTNRPAAVKFLKSPSFIQMIVLASGVRWLA